MEWPGRCRVPVQMQQLDFHGTLITPVVPRVQATPFLVCLDGRPLRTPCSGAGLASVCGAGVALLSGFLQKAEHR